MTHASVEVRELAAWGFDPYEFRPPAVQPRGHEPVSQRPAYKQLPALLHVQTHIHQAVLAQQAQRPDLLFEMEGFDWSLGVVDLRHLLSFQRRLSFDPAVPQPPVPAADDWLGLLNFTFPPTRPLLCDVLLGDARTLKFCSGDPNLQVRLSADLTRPIIAHLGSAFLEVAVFRGRFFLRDGYHRAYRLLRDGITAVPAVVVRAKTLAELGSARPQFFTEHTLFSRHPPHLIDFLEDRLTTGYTRPRVRKTLHITVRESYAPGPQGDHA